MASSISQTRRYTKKENIKCYNHLYVLARLYQPRTYRARACSRPLTVVFVIALQVVRPISPSCRRHLMRSSSTTLRPHRVRLRGSLRDSNGQATNMNTQQKYYGVNDDRDAAVAAAPRPDRTHSQSRRSRQSANSSSQTCRYETYDTPPAVAL